MKKTQKLLPIGFYDLLFDDAKKNHQQVNSVLDYFMDQGYRLIKPPLVEFASSYSCSSSKSAFQFLDGLSGENLILRNDITLQISRMLSSVLKDAQLPLKLCYVGDVLLMKSEELYADRQSTQLGLEVIGANEQSYQEVIAMILRILPELLDKKLAIEFSLPNFAPLFFDELKIAQKDELVEAVKCKNLSKIREIAGKNADLVCDIALYNNDLENSVVKILQKTSSPEIEEILNEALEIKNFVADDFAQIEIYFDIFGDDKNSYHQDLAFDVFCEGFSYPIARGGSYESAGQKAFGATIYMNYLRKV